MPRSKKKDPPLVIDPNQRWFTIALAAIYIQLCQQSVRSLIHSGELRAVHFGNTYRIDRRDLDELMLRKKRIVAPYRRGTHGWVRERHAAARKAGAR
jgi:excisionase family DNA binding protein